MWGSATISLKASKVRGSHRVWGSRHSAHGFQALPRKNFSNFGSSSCFEPQVEQGGAKIVGWKKGWKGAGPRNGWLCGPVKTLGACIGFGYNWVYIYIHDSIYKGSKYKPYRTGIYHIYIYCTNKIFREMFFSGCYRGTLRLKAISSRSHCSSGDPAINPERSTKWAVDLSTFMFKIPEQEMLLYRFPFHDDMQPE
jgi:hypothetical protein